MVKWHGDRRGDLPMAAKKEKTKERARAKHAPVTLSSHNFSDPPSTTHHLLKTHSTIEDWPGPYES